LSPKFVAKICHQNLSPKFVTKICHQNLSPKFITGIHTIGIHVIVIHTIGTKQGRNKLRNRIDVCDVIRFVSMTSSGSRAAPDCHTGQSKGRYCARALQSYSLVYYFLGTKVTQKLLRILKKLRCTTKTTTKNAHQSRFLEALLVRKQMASLKTGKQQL
jgi:hypothetical protein